MNIGQPYYPVYVIERKTETERTWSAVDVKLWKPAAKVVLENCKAQRPDAQFRIRVGQTFVK